MPSLFLGLCLIRTSDSGRRGRLAALSAEGETLDKKYASLIIILILFILNVNFVSTMKFKTSIWRIRIYMIFENEQKGWKLNVSLLSDFVLHRPCPRDFCTNRGLKPGLNWYWGPILKTVGSVGHTRRTLRSHASKFRFY